MPRSKAVATAVAPRSGGSRESLRAAPIFPRGHRRFGLGAAPPAPGLGPASWPRMNPGDSVRRSPPEPRARRRAQCARGQRHHIQPSHHEEAVTRLAPDPQGLVRFGRRELQITGLGAVSRRRECSLARRNGSAPIASSTVRPSARMPRIFSERLQSISNCRRVCRRIGGVRR